MSTAPRRMRYVARVGRATGRYGRVVTVPARHRSRALVEFPDGRRDLVPARCLRRIREDG